MMRSNTERIGIRSGRLVVICVFVDNVRFSRPRTMVRCLCDCGSEYACRWDHLKAGKTKSCGCLFSECVEASKIVPGGTRTERLYRVWYGMKQRCYNPKVASFKNYGARGIRICDEWRNSFLAFSKWAYANGFDPSLRWLDCTIDRVDVNGDYCPENCRFLTHKEQQNNRRQVPSRPVLMIGNQSNRIERFPSARIASELTGIPLSSIYMGCISGKPTKGRRWRYADDA